MHQKVLEKIFEKVNELDDVWLTNLTDYACFWKKKKFKQRETAWNEHNVFVENKKSKRRKIKGFYKGQLMRVEKKKISRRLHK